MADFESYEGEHDLVAALESHFSQPAEVEAPEEVEPEAAPQPKTEIQPQAAPEAAQPDDGVKASGEAEASADPTPAPVPVETPKPQPDGSLELSQRLSEADKTKQEAAAARDQYLQRLNTVVPQMEMAVAGEFADLKTPEDVFKLMQQDPARYNNFVIANTRLTQARSAQQQAQGEARQAYIAQEQANIAKAIPDMADPVKGPQLKDKLRAYARTLNIPEERMARSADEVVLLHSMMLKDEKIAAFEKAQATQAAALEEAKKKAAKAPQVQQPGSQRDTSKSEKGEADFERFDKSGKPDDLARYLQHIM